MSKAKKGAQPELRTLMVETNKGRMKVTIPADYKVTYSDTNPGGRGYGDDRALRIYESKDKQRACFVGVRSFYDISIPIERERVTKQGQSSWHEDEDGYSAREDVKVEREWEDED